MSIHPNSTTVQQAVCPSANNMQAPLFYCSNSRVLIMQGNSQVVFFMQTVPGWISWYNLCEPTGRCFSSHRVSKLSIHISLVCVWFRSFPLHFRRIFRTKSPLDFQHFPNGCMGGNSSADSRKFITGPGNENYKCIENSRLFLILFSLITGCRKLRIVQ